MTAIPNNTHIAVKTTPTDPFKDFQEDPVPLSRIVHRASEQKLPRATKPRLPDHRIVHREKPVEFSSKPAGTQSLFQGVTFQSVVEFCDPYGDESLEANLSAFERMRRGII